MGQEEKENITERILRRAIAIVVVMAFMVPFLSPKVFAETPITISSSDHVKGGDTFTVAVTFGSGSVGRVDAQMLYDTDMLTYVSGGSSSGNTGYIQLKNSGTEGSITFNIEFQALTEGDVTLEVTTNEMYDLDEMYIDTPSATKAITIEGDAEEEVLITETTSPEEPEETTQLIGVDEKPTEAEVNEENGFNNINLVFIFVAVVLVILIVIIAVLLASRKKGGSKPELHRDDQRHEGPSYDAERRDSFDVYNSSGYSQTPRVGRSGMILDEDRAYDDRPYDGRRDTGLRNDYDREEYDRIEQEVIRKRSREETAVWNDWDLGDDGPDDIEKW